MSASAEGASARGLFLTWAALMALAALSFGLRFAHLGALGMVAALGIAAVKALLVGLVFMELAFEKPSIRLAFAAGLLMIAIMLALMIADVVTRAVPPLENPPGTEPRAYGQLGLDATHMTTSGPWPGSGPAGSGPLSGSGPGGAGGVSMGSAGTPGFGGCGSMGLWIG